MRSRTSLPALCLVVGVAGLSTVGVGCSSEPPEEEDTLTTTHPMVGVEPDTAVLSAPASPESQAHGIYKWYVHYMGYSGRPRTGLTFFGVDAAGNYVGHGSIGEAETDAGLALQFFDQYDGTLIVEPEASAAASQIGIQYGTYGANVGAPHGNATSDLAVHCGLRPSCDYPITWDVMTNNGIGDPAPYVQKQFVAEWLCPTGPRSVATAPGEAIGQTIHLDCANPAVPAPVDPSGQLPLRAVVDTLSSKGDDLFHLWANDMQNFAAPGAPADPAGCNAAKANVVWAYANMVYVCRTGKHWVGLGACALAAGYVVAQRIAQKAACKPAPGDQCTDDSQCVAAHGPNFRCDVPSGTCVPKALQPPPAGNRGPVYIAVNPPIYIPWPSPPGGGCNDEWDCFAGSSCYFGVCS